MGHIDFHDAFKGHILGWSGLSPASAEAAGALAEQIHRLAVSVGTKACFMPMQGKGNEGVAILCNDEDLTEYLLDAFWTTLPEPYRISRLPLKSPEVVAEVERLRAVHTQEQARFITADGLEAGCDFGIAPAIRHLNALGIQTDWSCQGWLGPEYEPHFTPDTIPPDFGCQLHWRQAYVKLRPGASFPPYAIDAFLDSGFLNLIGRGFVEVCHNFHQEELFTANRAFIDLLCAL